MTTHNCSETEKILDEYNRKFNALFKFALEKLNDNYHAAEDLMQDLAVSILKKNNYLEDGKVKSGNFYQFIRKRSIDYFRRDNNEKGNVKYDSEIIGNLCEKSDENNPLEIALKSEEIDIVRGCICELPDDDRKTLVLRYYENMEIKEIGSKIERTKPVVLKRLKRARDYIKNSMRYYYHLEVA